MQIFLTQSNLLFIFMIAVFFYFTMTINKQDV